MDRSALRITVVVALWLATVVIGSLGLARNLIISRGYAGFDLDDTLTITAVVPGGPADRAGIRVGDRLDAHSLYATRRTYDPVLYYYPASWRPGTRIHFTMLRAGRQYPATLTLTTLANIGPTRENVQTPLVVYSMIVGWVVSVIALSIAAWLLIVRPSVMTWSFFAFSSGSAWSPYDLSRYGYEVHVAVAVLLPILSAMSIFLITFAVRAPDNTPTGWQTWVDRCVPVLWLAIATVNSYPSLVWVFSGNVVGIPPFLRAVANVFTAYWFIPTAVLSLMLITYLRLHGINRQRMKWILFGTAVWAAPSLLYAILNLRMPYYSLFIFAEVAGAISTFGIAIIAYGVVRSRVVDVAFFISRGVVLAVLAAATVIVFGVLDYVFMRRLENARLGSIAEIIAAIAVGFSFQGLHRRIDSTVDRLLFIRRYKAQHRLARAARAILHADDASLIRNLLVAEAADALDLASAALFDLVDTGFWRRMDAIGWAHCELKELTNANPLVLYLQSEQAGLRTSTVRGSTQMMPSGNAHPVLALPILMRHRVIAIVLYGMHNTGADLDADEIRSLEALANAAGTAFAQVDAQHLRVTGDALRVRVRDLEFEAGVQRRQIANLTSILSASSSAEALQHTKY